MSRINQPAFPLTRKHRYDGVGGFAKDSHDIPASAIVGAVAFVIGFIALAYVGVAVGF